MSTLSGKGRGYLKMTIDVVMAVTFVLLMDTHVLGGLSFHEIAGLVIGGFFAVHVLLNWNWVVNITARFSKRQIPGRTKFSYGLNALLLAAMAFIIVSGVLVSRVVVPDLHVPNKRWFSHAHVFVGFAVLAVVGVHVGLHWNWITMITRRVLGGRWTFGRYGTLAAVLCTVGLLTAGGVQMQRGRGRP
jgi:hypothetical protein